MECRPNPRYGAGDGNRTRTASLEGWNSTIELHPHFFLITYILYNIFERKSNFGVRDGARSRNIRSHSAAFYQLNYSHHIRCGVLDVLSRDNPFTSCTPIVELRRTFLQTLSDLHGAFLIAFRTTWKDIFLNTRGIFCIPLPWAPCGWWSR